MVSRDGASTILSRGAFAAGSTDDISPNQDVTLRLHWTHARILEGDRLVLKLDANDPSWFMPYPADYTATFDAFPPSTFPC